MRDHTKLRAFELADEEVADLPDSKSGDFGAVRVRPNTFDFWKSPSVP